MCIVENNCTLGIIVVHMATAWHLLVVSLSVYSPHPIIMLVGQFSVPHIEYLLRGSSKKGNHVYFLLQVFWVILLFFQIVLLFDINAVLVSQ